VLLRMHDKFKIWLSVGGHIELDEDPVEAAIREVKEEVGLEIKIVGEAHGPLSGHEDNRGYKYLIPPRYLGRHPVGPNHEHIAMVYFALSDTDVLSDSVSEHERSTTVWVTKAELEKMDLVPNVRFYAGEALRELSS
jgi:8-oxo-dGTP pyrophosphatase MutT (NUDIX family)